HGPPDSDRGIIREQQRFGTPEDHRIEPERVGNDAIVMINARCRGVGIAEHARLHLRLELAHLPGLIAIPSAGIRLREPIETRALHRKERYGDRSEQERASYFPERCPLSGENPIAHLCVVGLKKLPRSPCQRNDLLTCPRSEKRIIPL